jgi:ABC-type phosphate transport system permease subunit
MPIEKEDYIEHNENIAFSENNEWKDPFVTFFKFLFAVLIIIIIIIILLFFLDKKYPFIE